MTWTKLSDDFTDDCWTLSDAAFRLHTDALVWSNRKLLDLRIPKEEVRRFAKTPEAVPELLLGGWWTEEGNSYVVLHHARYQRTKAAVITQQRVNKENRAQRGKATPPTREQAVRFPSSNDSFNESKNDSHDEMDRTGLANYEEGDERALNVEESTGAVGAWPVVAIPGSVSDSTSFHIPMEVA